MTTTDTESSAPWPVPPGSVAPESLRETLEAMTYLLPHLEFDVVGLLDLDPEDPGVKDVWRHDLAVVIDALETVIDKAKEVQAAASVAFCRSLPFPAPSNVSYADTRPLVPRFPKNRTAWHNDDLRRDLLAAVVAKSDAPPATTEAVFGLVESIVTVSGGNAKTTGIKKFGLDPDDYCHSEKQDPNVQVVK